MRLDRRWLLLAGLPPLAVYVGYLLVPLVTISRLSFKGFGYISGVQDVFTLTQYQHVFRDTYYLSAWVNTLRLSLESAVLTVVIGSAVAYYMWSIGGRVRTFLTAIVFAPLLVSGVVRAFGWITVIGPTGAMQDLTSRLGFGRFWVGYGETAVVITFVHVFLPFAVVAVLIELDAIPVSVLRAAANLGAGRLSVTAKVLLPLTLRATASSALLIFALATASYAVPAIMGGGRVLTIASIIYQEENVTLNWPRGAAIGLTLTVVTIACMLAYQFLAGRRANVASVARA